MRARTNRIVGQPGAIHAVLYHGSHSPPDDFSRYLKEGFQFKGAGGMYGYGLYTIFKTDPKSQTFTGGYGPNIYKLAARLKGMIVFDHDAAVKVYGPNPPTVADQVRALSPGVSVDWEWETWENAPEFSSDWAEPWWKSAKYTDRLPNGIIFRGRHDGFVCVLYHPENVSLLGWKKAGESDFKKLISAGRDWRQESSIDPVKVKTGKPETGRIRLISQHALKAFILKDMVPIPGRNYAMSRYEVTQEIWKSVMGSNPSNDKGAKHPVVIVSWNDCQNFCQKVKELTGLPVRLPTEEEWEYAARGGEDFEYAGSNNIDEVAWYGYNSNGTTHPVGQKKPNGYGLYDMSGNVWEWTSTPDPESRGKMATRGGSWYYSAHLARVARRISRDPGYRNDNLGLRLAMDLGS